MGGVGIFSGTTYHIFTEAHLTYSSFLGSNFSIKFSLQLSLPLFFHFLLFLICFPFLCFLSFLNLFILQPCLGKIHQKESLDVPKGYKLPAQFLTINRLSIMRPHLMVNQLIQPLHYHGHFILAQTKLSHSLILLFS